MNHLLFRHIALRLLAGLASMWLGCWLWHAYVPDDWDKHWYGPPLCLTAVVTSVSSLFILVYGITAVIDAHDKAKP